MDTTRRTLLMGTLALAGGSRLASGAEPPAQALIQRVIPFTGERIPVVGIGANDYDVESPGDLAARREVLREFPALGGRVIDSAPGLRLVRASDLMPLLREYKREKRIRYIGATTAAPRQHAQFIEVMRRQPLGFVQVDYSIANRAAARDLLPLAQERGMAVLNNMPLGGRDASLFSRAAGRKLVDLAAEIGAATWARRSAGCSAAQANGTLPGRSLAVSGETADRKGLSS